MRQLQIQLSLILASAAIAAGCPGFGDEEGPLTEVPEYPTWTNDVQPLMERYCDECHSVPTQQGAPGFFRTDECDDANDGTLGASSMAERNSVRTAQLKSMPPASYGAQPTELERQVFQRWFDTGAPCVGTGTENPNNTTTNNTNAANNTTTNSANNATNSSNSQNNTVSSQFEDVALILRENCGAANCHGSPNHISDFEISRDSSLDEVRLALEDVSVTRGPLVVPENPDGSRLYVVVSTANIDERMPPAANGYLQLVQPQLDAIRIWIENGAPYE